MFKKKTVLFFTGRYNTAVAENVLKELRSDPSAVGVIVTKKELENHILNGIVDKLIPEESKLRYLIRNKRLAICSINSDRTRSQKTIFNPRSGLQRHILNALERYNPSVVAVTNYTLLADVLAALDKYGKNVKTVVISEEFVLDKRLIQRSVDYYFVDNFDMRNDLAECGIPDDKISIVTIPVAREFFEKNDREEALKKFALDGHKPVILVSASALGDGRFIKVAEKLKEGDFDVDYIIACGKNRTFLNAVRDLGFNAYNEGVDMNAALNACDLVVARPTTMLLAETLVKKKPVIALLPNGKVEEDNLEYLATENVTKVDGVENLNAAVKKFLDELRAAERPDVAETALKEGGENEEKKDTDLVEIPRIDESGARIIAEKLLAYAEEFMEESEKD